MSKRIFYALLAASICPAAVQASTITYVTPPGSTTTGPVSASATFTTGAGTLLVTLNDLEANPADVSQLISDLDIVLSNGATAGTLTSSSGQQITVNTDGSFVLGNIGSTGWGLNNNVGGGLQLDALGYIGPAGLILGPPGSGGFYSNANGSIAGNNAHNPFLNQTATFNLSIPGVTSSTTVTSATFSFGTTAGLNLGGQVFVPEPSGIALVIGGLGALYSFRSRRKA